MIDAVDLDVELCEGMGEDGSGVSAWGCGVRVGVLVPWVWGEGVVLVPEMWGEGRGAGA